MSSSAPSTTAEASWPRRTAALIVDWLACMFGVIVFMGPSAYFTPGSSGSMLTLGVFVLESTIFITLMGGSFGKLVTRLRVVRVDGRGGLDPLRALLRSVLVALVIPPLVFRPDGRGLHDLAVGSATVRLRA